MTFTENGAPTYSTTGSACLDLFAAIGAIRKRSDGDIVSLFVKAYAEDRDTAMKILFFGRDVRGGLGERRVFRTIMKYLSVYESGSVKKNLALIPEYGRYDDLLSLIGTPCEGAAIRLIGAQLKRDEASEEGVSLLAKWLPSVNASSPETVKCAKHIAKSLGMSEREYRKLLTSLRKKIRIIENNLRVRDYTFDYSAQPSRAMLKYRSAFLRNDGERYGKFLRSVKMGEAKLNTGALTPYDIVSKMLDRRVSVEKLSDGERAALDVTWRSLPNYVNGENALAVIDGSGSMYSGAPTPASVALSLGIYFAERNEGIFKNHFITFSRTPQLVEIKGRDITERVRYCASYNEVANTDILKVFELILNTALKHGIQQAEMPSRLYIISDMEFDYCVEQGDGTNFEYARGLYEKNGYRLPEVVFWNVDCRSGHQPVKINDVGAALVSGCTPRLFEMVVSGELSPYQAMLDVVGSERYSKISA